MDYRTEVYGLMRAQLTKNAIIVPAGAKGGFIVKRRRSTRPTIEESYVTYIRSLLDVTDNLVDGEVVHPAGVRVRDDDDTYLVVAADKGTATFSDTANAIAREYGFWLDDAFASGGSVGYDHKKLGITARGAWESVKRHFRELGMDPARDEFTAVGIGDMSGDVFGNGMLLSDKIKLLGAYDHRHVFIDPEPDAAASFAERKRLFEMPGSSWDDYSASCLRGRRRVPARRQVDRAVRPRARAARPRRGARGAERGDPRDPARAGRPAVERRHRHRRQGVDESDADAHDRSSDAIRVDARELRCRVVGEGGNLGFTRRARVEYSAGGGRINADFIDNSAGVDCSDHEVNLKILLGLAERRGEMTRAERDELLEAVTEDVVEHVLYDSFLQAQIIAQEVGRSPARLFAYEDLDDAARGDGAARPREREPADQRRAHRAAARRARARAAGAGDPARVRQDAGWRGRWRPAGSPTTRGSSATCAPTSRPRSSRRCGHLLGRAPAAHAADLHDQRELGRERARPDVRLAAGGRARRRRRRGRARVPDRRRGDRRRPRCGRRSRGSRASAAAAQMELLGGVDALVEATARWYLTWAPGAALEETIAAGRDGFERLAAVLPQLGTEERRARPRRDRRAARAARGCRRRSRRPTRCAPSSSTRPTWSPSPPRPDRSIEDVARVFFALGGELRLDWMERELARVRSATRMQRWALQAVREDAFKARRELAECALRESAGADRSSPSSTSCTPRPRPPGASTPSSARSRARASPTSPVSRWRCASSARWCRSFWG